MHVKRPNACKGEGATVLTACIETVQRNRTEKTARQMADRRAGRLKRTLKARLSLRAPVRHRSAPTLRKTPQQGTSFNRGRGNNWGKYV